MNVDPCNKTCKRFQLFGRDIKEHILQHIKRCFVVPNTLYEILISPPRIILYILYHGLECVSFIANLFCSPRLSTPAITMPATLPICVRFDYFMGGFNIGRLTVYDSTREWEDRVFDKTGHQGNDWISTQETLLEFRDDSKVHSLFIRMQYY